MKLIIRGQHTGKTEELIRMAAADWLYIVCMDRHMAQRTFDRARQMGLEIPFPLTFHEFRSRRFFGLGIKGFLIDNLDALVADMAGPVPVKAAVMDAEEPKAKG